MALKIALYQMNAWVGDLSGNTDRLLAQIELAKAQGAHLFMAPELALCGYPPEDLLLRADFYQQCQVQLQRLLAVEGITLLIGCPYHSGSHNFNSVFALSNGAIIGRYDKRCLPNYGVFDECRYFTPGVTSLVIEVAGVQCGVIICEDLWQSEPMAAVVAAGAELVLVLNGSPFEMAKHKRREQVAAARVYETKVPLIYLNLVGGQDELVFDGASFALSGNGDKIWQLPAFSEQLAYLEYKQGNLVSPSLPASYPQLEASLYQALVMALSDYVSKNNFPGVVLGLSGGIDSALTLAIAVDALGAKRVMAVMMPSPFTATISIADSRTLVAKLGVSYHELNIEPLFNGFKASLAPLFAGRSEDTTEENLQARIRGTLLMAISNKFGHLVVTTGNKSEMTTGYATLYGDMAGGFALLKDLPKTMVFALAKWRNREQELIPARIISRPPSAELRPDQCDQDSLPEYEILDAIMQGLVDQRYSSSDLVAQGFAAAEVAKVARLLKLNEYKRRQAAVGPKLTEMAFSRDWRMPNTNHFKY